MHPRKETRFSVARAIRVGPPCRCKVIYWPEAAQFAGIQAVSGAAGVGSMIIGQLTNRAVFDSATIVQIQAEGDGISQTGLFARRESDGILDL